MRGITEHEVRRMENRAKKELLKIEHMSVCLGRQKKTEESLVISDLNLSVQQGEIVAIIGASGSGKSLLAHSMMGILPAHAKLEGNFFWKGQPFGQKKIEELRGKEIALVPQSVNYLDPLMKVGKQVRNGKKDRETIKKQKELFQNYHLEEKVENLYPFECSGGMIRRILLCIAWMIQPQLIIADEPTPGLDDALTKKVMRDFREFAEEGNGLLWITHEIELALETADRIVVFYDGKTIEDVSAIDFKEGNITHPYAKALWQSISGNRCRQEKR